MSDRYKVMVERITTDADGDDAYETVAELLAPREQLARFAPGVVAEVLGAPAEPMALVTGNADDMLAAANGLAAVKAAAEDKPKRTRRTRAEIEAAKAAEPAPEPPGAPDAQEDNGGPVVPTAVGPAVPFNPFAPK